jgi:protoheme IX farnesyltransferase
LPLGLVKPVPALIFAIAIGAIGVAIFAILFNLLSATLAIATIAFYSFFYTLYLKPRTPYNIVIGGAAGSMAPIIAWAAVGGNIALAPVMLSLLIFLWTPPHFWARALYLRSDYELVNYPMMPIARGDQATKRQILFYVLILVLFSAACIYIGAGIIYIIVAAITGTLFIYKAALIAKSKTNELARGLFGYSIVYLFMLLRYHFRLQQRFPISIIKRCFTRPYLRRREPFPDAKDNRICLFNIFPFALE